jgi:hypothetical protein
MPFVAHELTIDVAVLEGILLVGDVLWTHEQGGKRQQAAGAARLS